MVSGSAAGLISDGHGYIDFDPPTGITLGELQSLANDWGFQYYMETTAVNWGPHLQLTFAPDLAGYVATPATDFIDITVMAAQTTDLVEGAWTEVALSSSLTSVGYWGDSSGVVNDPGMGQTFETALTEIVAVTGIDTTWVLVLVRVELYESGARNCYIDDVRIDGVTYDLEDSTAIGTHLMISTDDGRTWEETDYAADTDGSTITAMAVSSEDADVLYVADATNVWKTDDAGDSWTDLGAVIDPDNPSTTYLVAITCLAVGYEDEIPHIFVGGDELTGAGEVFYYQDAPFASTWIDLDVCAPDNSIAIDSSDVWGIATSPDFDSDTLVVVVIQSGTQSFVSANVGAGIGTEDWDDLELLDDLAASYVITGATNPVFVGDFDIVDAYELFVGVSGLAHDGSLGGVYRITGMTNADDFLLPDVDDDIVSLDVVGDLAYTSLLAGTDGIATAVGPGSIWYSTDDGDDWDETDKAPTGAGATQNYVIVDDDFADSGIAWCASNAATKEGGFHLTTDFGATWNGISLLDTDMGTAVYDIAFSPDYGTGDDAPMFMVTESSVGANADDSVWKYDGTNWERVWYDATNELDLVEVSPGYAGDTAVFVADSAGAVILYSHDGGANFTEMIRQPDSAITSWVVIDDETIITGASGGAIYKTVRYGRRIWDESTVPAAAGLITDLAVLGDTVLAGDDESQVFISTDGGDEFEEVSASDVAGFVTLAAGNNTYVAFDPRYASNNFIYAASDNIVARCEIDESEDMGDLEFDNFANAGTIPGLITVDGPSGIVVSDDGTQAGESVATLYVMDAVSPTTGTQPGVWRCLNPADTLADVVFELASAGLAAEAAGQDFAPVGGTTIRNLELSPGNILYSIDTVPIVDVPDVIYTYEDTLAKPVELTSPTNGAKLEDEERVSFGWDDLNADTVNVYEIWVNEEEDFPTATDKDVGTCDQDGTALTTTSAYTDDNELLWRTADPGTEYFWKVRVGISSATGGGPVLSRWSDTRSFMTKVGMTDAPVQVRPLPGAQDIILTPSFSWLAVTGADLYEIEVATDAGFTSLVTSATALVNAWATDVELDYSTVYYWRVRGISSSGAPAGDWVISIFTTMVKVEAAPAPVEVTTVPAPDVTVTVPVTEITPAWIWAIIAIGAVLCIAVIVLIVRTRRVV
ncbi:hypothetical protein ES703_47344 [subsurface metagenome]